MIDRDRLKQIPAINGPYRLLRFIAFQAQVGVANVRDIIANSANHPDVQVPPARLRFRSREPGSIELFADCRSTRK
jgi:hypothetical protein